MVRGDLVAQLDLHFRARPTTEQSVFVSGAFPRPIIGPVKSEDDKKISASIKAERLNYKTKTRI